MAHDGAIPAQGSLQLLGTSVLSPTAVHATIGDFLVPDSFLVKISMVPSNSDRGLPPPASFVPLYSAAGLADSPFGLEAFLAGTFAALGGTTSFSWLAGRIFPAVLNSGARVRT